MNRLMIEAGREKAVCFDDNNFVQQVHCPLFAKHRVLAGIQFLAKQTASCSICDQKHLFAVREVDIVVMVMHSLVEIFP